MFFYILKSRSQLAKIFKTITRSWEARVKKLSNGLNVSGLIQESHLPIRTALNVLKETLSNKDSEIWNKQLNDSEKLRTYETYKNT